MKIAVVSKANAYNPPFGNKKANSKPSFKANTPETSLREKYLKRDWEGKIPAMKIGLYYFPNYLNEIKENSPEIMNEIMTAECNKGGNILHWRGSWDIIKDAMSDMEDADEKFLNMFLKKDKIGKLPVHYHLGEPYTNQVSEFFDKNIVKKLYTTEDNSGNYPSNICMKDGELSSIINLFDDYETKDNIFFHRNKENKTPTLRGYQDLETFLDVYQDKPQKVKEYFFDKNSNLNPMKLYYLKDGDCIELLQERLSPKFLKEIYTAKEGNGRVFSDCVYNTTPRIGYYGDCLTTQTANPSFSFTLAKSIVDLSKNKELSKEESNELLNANIEMFETIDLIQEQNLKEICGMSMDEIYKEIKK